jgi:hypothetical protein
MGPVERIRRGAVAYPHRVAIIAMAVALLGVSGFAIASSPPANKLVLTVSPPRATPDQPVTVSVGNAPPASTVRVKATLRDRYGRSWRSLGVFRADTDGNVNTSEMPSTGGTYVGTDATGLFWSLSEVGPGWPFNGEPLLPSALARRTRVRLTATVSGKQPATATLIWHT